MTRLTPIIKGNIIQIMNLVFIILTITTRDIDIKITVQQFKKISINKFILNEKWFINLTNKTILTDVSEILQ